MNKIVFGKCIAKKRREKGLSQEALAEMLGYTNKTISKWENGAVIPSLQTIQEVCEAMDIPFEEALGLDVEKIVEKYFNEKKIKEKTQPNFSSVNRVTFINLVLVAVLVIVCSFFTLYVSSKSTYYVKYNDSIKVYLVKDREMEDGKYDLFKYSTGKKYDKLSLKYVTVENGNKDLRIYLMAFKDSVSNYFKENDGESAVNFIYSESMNRTYLLPDYIYYYNGNLDEVGHTLSFEEYKLLKDKMVILWERKDNI